MLAEKEFGPMMRWVDRPRPPQCGPLSGGRGLKARCTVDLQVRLDQLGRSRPWAERAAHGECIAVVNADGRPIAYLIPATEPITREFVTWYLDRWPQLDDASRRVMREHLRAMARAGCRYSRARDVFLPASSA
jgi:hypothetical protein